VLALRHAVGVRAYRLDNLQPADVPVAMAGMALRMLEVTFWPSDVSFDVTAAPVPLTLAVVLVVGLALATFVLAKWLVRRDRAAAGVALFGFSAFWATVLLHVPVLLRIGAISDRYAYGVVLGMACVAVALLSVVPIPARLPIRESWRLPLLAVGILALFPMTWARGAEWRDEEHLQAAMYRVRPDDPQSLLAEGMRRLRREEYDEAYPLCRAYAEAKPNSHRAGYCLGHILMLRGEARAAARVLEPHAFARPGVVPARIRLFQAWFASNDLEGVRRGLEYYRQIWPDASDLKAAEVELERRTKRKAK
jgi:hypothetical protein